MPEYWFDFVQEGIMYTSGRVRADSPEEAAAILAEDGIEAPEVSGHLDKVFEPLFQPPGIYVYPAEVE